MATKPVKLSAAEGETFDLISEDIQNFDLQLSAPKKIYVYDALIAMCEALREDAKKKR